jgi:hypothetical protein
LVGASWVLLLVAWGLSLVMPALLPFAADPVLFWISVLLGVLFLPLAFYNLRLARQLERESVLLNSLVPDSAAALSDRIREFLDIQSEDINLRMRLVEGLMAAGQPVEAAIESRLILKRDPFHFGAHLTLAQSYFDLRLYPECREICRAYLKLVPYSFELGDLDQRAAECDKNGGAHAT